VDHSLKIRANSCPAGEGSRNPEGTYGGFHNSSPLDLGLRKLNLCHTVIAR